MHCSFREAIEHLLAQKVDNARRELAVWRDNCCESAKTQSVKETRKAKFFDKAYLTVGDVLAALENEIVERICELHMASALGEAEQWTMDVLQLFREWNIEGSEGLQQLVSKLRAEKTQSVRVLQEATAQMELLESRVATLSDENAQLQEETRRLALELKEKDVIRGRRGSPESATTSSTESERTDQLFTSLMAQLKESMERASVTLEVQAVRANALPDLTKFRGESPADSQVLAKHIAIFRMKYPLSAFSEEERCILFEASPEGKPLSVFRSAPESTLEGKLVYLKEAIKGHEGVRSTSCGLSYSWLKYGLLNIDIE